MEQAINRNGEGQELDEYACRILEYSAVYVEGGKRKEICKPSILHR